MKIRTLPYLGNKGRLIKELIARFPSHDRYVEPFGGTGAVLLNKPRVSLEVYNDINRHVVNMYRVIRDKKQVQDLLYLLEYTPYSRDETRSCREAMNYSIQHSGEPIDPLHPVSAKGDIELARCYIVSQLTAMFGEGRSFRNDASRVKRWNQRIDDIQKIHDRIQGVIIEMLDWERVFNVYDRKTALFYCDPPYNPDTCHDSTHYNNMEFSTEHHKTLITRVKKLKGTAIISGYEDQLYIDSLYSMPLKEAAKSASPKKNRGGVVEWIYSNKEIKNKQLDLFGGL